MTTIALTLAEAHSLATTGRCVVRRKVKRQPEQRGEIHGRAAFYWPTKQSEAGYVHTGEAALARIMEMDCPFGQPGGIVLCKPPRTKGCVVRSGSYATLAAVRCERREAWEWVVELERKEQ